jgi:hypothetical protein
LSVVLLLTWVDNKTTKIIYTMENLFGEIACKRYDIIPNLLLMYPDLYYFICTNYSVISLTLLYDQIKNVVKSHMNEL